MKWQKLSEECHYSHLAARRRADDNAPMSKHNGKEPHERTVEAVRISRGRGERKYSYATETVGLYYRITDLPENDATGLYRSLRGVRENSRNESPCSLETDRTSGERHRARHPADHDARRLSEPGSHLHSRRPRADRLDG